MNNDTVLQFIENIFHSKAQIAFILESPHIDEMHHGYPLAGKSGREMSKYLLNRYDVPLGFIAKTQDLFLSANCLVTNLFSIINVSKQPLQRKAYNNCNIPDNINLMEKLKKLIEQGATFQTKHRQEELNLFKSEIYNSFKLECRKELKKKTILVPCGKFANLFTSQLIEDLPNKKFKLIKGIPHPSRNWKRLELNKIDAIKKVLCSSR